MEKFNIKVKINNKEEYIKAYNILHKYRQKTDDDMTIFDEYTDMLICLRETKEWGISSDDMHGMKDRLLVDFDEFENILKSKP